MPPIPAELLRETGLTAVMMFGLWILGRIGLRALDRYWDAREKEQKLPTNGKTEVIIAKLDQIYGRVNDVAHNQHEYNGKAQEMYGELVADVVLLVKAERK